jgi:hypothetical protein
MRLINWFYRKFLGWKMRQQMLAMGYTREELRGWGFWVRGPDAVKRIKRGLS